MPNFIKKASISMFFQPCQSIGTCSLASEAFTVSIIISLLYQIRSDSPSFQRPGYECVDNDKRTVPDNIFDIGHMSLHIGFKPVLLFQMSDFQVHVSSFYEAGNKMNATYFFKAS